MTAPSPPTRGRLERGVETLLWNCRFLVLGAVVITVLLAVGELVLAAVDTAHLGRLVWRYAVTDLPGDMRSEARTEVVTTVVKALDNCLIAALLIVVAFGLYELFIDRIDIATEATSAGRLLHVASLEDLKQRVAKLVVLALAVEFFQIALQLPVGTALDLLYLAGGIFGVSVALYLTNVRTGPRPPRGKE